MMVDSVLGGTGILKLREDPRTKMVSLASKKFLTIDKNNKYKNPLEIRALKMPKII